MVFYNKKYEVTFDDVLFLPNKVEFAMDDEDKEVDTSVILGGKIKLKRPILSSPMPGVTEVEMAIALAEMGGLGIIHSFQSFERQLEQVKKVKQKQLPVAATVIDLREHTMNHIKDLVAAGLDLLVIYTYHSYDKNTLQFIRKVRKKYPNLALSTGPIVTKEGTRAVIQAGADIVNIGIGPGSHCTTRLVTGVGRPQLSAVEECAREAKKLKASIVSEGGIKYSGDIAKAIAFGADAVMIGGLFSGTYESPGDIIPFNGKPHKNSSGMCSIESANLVHLQKHESGLIKKFNRIVTSLFGLKTQNASTNTNFLQEGISSLIPYKGSVKPMFEQLTGGLQRSMWYLGCRNLSEIKKKARVIMISSNSNAENVPRV